MGRMIIRFSCSVSDIEGSWGARNIDADQPSQITDMCLCTQFTCLKPLVTKHPVMAFTQMHRPEKNCNMAHAGQIAPQGEGKSSLCSLGDSRHRGIRRAPRTSERPLGVLQARPWLFKPPALDKLLFYFCNILLLPTQSMLLFL
jgi:hypothetical protein